MGLVLCAQLLFRRWNDTSEWPGPETARERRLDLASRVLIGAAVTAILLAGLLKLLSLAGC